MAKVNFGSKLTKFFKNPMESAFNFFGENPDSAVYIAVSIAVFKSIFRPLYTMTDKKTDPRAKKYTAWREFLTEAIAIPVYALLPTIGKNLIVDKKFKNAPTAVKKAAEANTKFWCVLASTAIIPAICNVVQPPIMKAITKRGEAKKAIIERNNIEAIDTTNKPSFKSKYPLTLSKSYNNYGMRVGN